MCFVYDDYDWCPTDVTQEMLVHDNPDTPLQCCECRKRNILHGDTYEYVEYKEENNDYSGEEDVDKNGPAYLNEEEYVTCLACYSYREAIHAVEIREGCSIYNSRPAYTDLFEDTRYSDHYTDYWEECIKANPWMRDVRYKYYEDKEEEDFYAKRWWVQCVMDTKYFI